MRRAQSPITDDLRKTSSDVAASGRVRQGSRCGDGAPRSATAEWRSPRRGPRAGARHELVAGRQAASSRHVPIDRTASAPSMASRCRRSVVTVAVASRAGQGRARGRRVARARTAARGGAGAGPRGAVRRHPGRCRPWPAGPRAAARWPAWRARRASRSRSSSRGPQRWRRWRPNARSSSLSATRSAVAPVAGSAPAGTSSATTAFRKSGWSSTPTGFVRYRRETPRRRAPGRAASAATASVSVRRASPTFAPSPMYARNPPPSPTSDRRLESAPCSPCRRANPAPARPAEDAGELTRLLVDGPRASWRTTWPRASARARRGRRARRSSAEPDAPTFGHRLRGHAPAASAGRASSCWARARSRSRRTRTSRRCWPRLRNGERTGAREQPLLVRRARRSATRRFSPACRTCHRTTRCRAGSRRRPCTRSTSCRVAGASRSTWTRRSTSSSSAPPGCPEPLRSRIDRAPHVARPRRARAAGRRRPGPRAELAGRRAPVARDPALARAQDAPAASGRSWRSAGCGRRVSGADAPALAGRLDARRASVLGLLLERRAAGRARASWPIARRRGARSTRGCCSPIGSAPTRRAGRRPRTATPRICCSPDRVRDPWLARAHASARARRSRRARRAHASWGPGLPLALGLAPHEPAARTATARPPTSRSASDACRSWIRSRCPGASRRLVDADRATRSRASGPMTFARFMELALYDPGAGYYRAAGSRPGPARGDFLTAPESHPIFGWPVGAAGREVWNALGRPDRVRRSASTAPATARWPSGILDGLASIRLARSLEALRYQPIDVDAARGSRPSRDRLGEAGLERRAGACRRAPGRQASSSPTSSSTRCRSTASRAARPATLLERYVDRAE